MSDIYKGGYITIDMLGLEIGDSDHPATIPGVYGKIMESYGKPIVYKNINLNGLTFDVLIPVGTFINDDDIIHYLDPLGTVVLAVDNEDDAVYIISE